MKSFFKKFFTFALYLFATIGLAFTAVYFAMRVGAFNVRGSIAERNQFYHLGGDTPASKSPVCTDAVSACQWNETPEWSAISGGLEKDTNIILTVAEQTGISPRILAAVVVPEQTRFFTANREIFKSYFEPLKLLGSLTQFSLGISGIKQETAVKIEQYANDPSSEFYPGAGMSDLIAYAEGADYDAVLYQRLTDSKDHYYQYLYTALYVKEIQSQWSRAGFDISRNPGVIVTLFNLGFQHSRPKESPLTAGSPIKTGGKTYSYGELGALFYNSDELAGLFPHL